MGRTVIFMLAVLALAILVGGAIYFYRRVLIPKGQTDEDMYQDRVVRWHFFREQWLAAVADGSIEQHFPTGSETYDQLRTLVQQMDARYGDRELTRSDWYRFATDYSRLKTLTSEAAPSTPLAYEWRILG